MTFVSKLNWSEAPPWAGVVSVKGACRCDMDEWVAADVRSLPAG
jgi:hypothetical protein